MMVILMSVTNFLLDLTLEKPNQKLNLVKSLDSTQLDPNPKPNPKLNPT